MVRAVRRVVVCVLSWLYKYVTQEDELYPSVVGRKANELHEKKCCDL